MSSERTPVYPTFNLQSFSKLNLSEYFDNSSTLIKARAKIKHTHSRYWHRLSLPEPSEPLSKDIFTSWKWLKVKDRWNQYHCPGPLSWQVACIRYGHQQQSTVHCWHCETAAWPPTAHALQLWMLPTRPFGPVYCSALQNNTTIWLLTFLQVDGWIYGLIINACIVGVSACITYICFWWEDDEKCPGPAPISLMWHRELIGDGCNIAIMLHKVSHPGWPSATNNTLARGDKKQSWISSVQVGLELEVGHPSSRHSLDIV